MNNESAIGYMIYAVRRLHLSAVVEEKLEAAMKSAMDEYTEDEANEFFRSAGVNA